MSEEQTAQTGTEAVTGTETATETTTGGYYNEDGTFKEGWQEKVVPQEYQHLKQIWSGVKTPADMAKMIGNQNATISRQGKGIFPLNENSTPSEKEAFAKAIGVPDTPQGYEFQPPEDVKQYYDPEITSQFQTVAKENLFTPQQYTAVMAFYANMMKQSEEAMNNDPMAFYEEILPKVQEIQAAEAEKTLREKWGDQYDSRLHLANKAIAENVENEEEKQALLSRIGNDPMVADFLATIQNKHFSEANGVDTSLGGSYGRMNTDQQIEALMNNPHYLDGKTNPSEHARLVSEVNRLLSKKSGGKILE